MSESTPTLDSGPPPNPRHGRQRFLVVTLQVLLGATVAAAAIALVGAGRPGEVAGTAMVVLLIAAPVVRVAWLFVRWARLGDRRFALVAAALLVVLMVAIGSA